jgi:hypothetical protein
MRPALTVAAADGAEVMKLLMVFLLWARPVVPGLGDEFRLTAVGGCPAVRHER